MSLNRRAIKRRAAEIMAASKPRVLLVGLVYLLLSALFETLSTRALNVNVSETGAANYLNYAMEGNYEYAMKYLAGMQPPNTAYLPGVDAAAFGVWLGSAGGEAPSPNQYLYLRGADPRGCP